MDRYSPPASSSWKPLRARSSWSHPAQQRLARFPADEAHRRSLSSDSDAVGRPIGADEDGQRGEGPLRHHAVEDVHRRGVVGQGFPRRDDPSLDSGRGCHNTLEKAVPVGNGEHPDSLPGPDQCGHPVVPDEVAALVENNLDQPLAKRQVAQHHRRLLARARLDLGRGHRLAVAEHPHGEGTGGAPPPLPDRHEKVVTTRPGGAPGEVEGRQGIVGTGAALDQDSRRQRRQVGPARRFAPARRPVGQDQQVVWVPRAGGDHGHDRRPVDVGRDVRPVDPGQNRGRRRGIEVAMEGGSRTGQHEGHPVGPPEGGQVFAQPGRQEIETRPAGSGDAHAGRHVDQDNLVERGGAARPEGGRPGGGGHPGGQHEEEHGQPAQHPEAPAEGGEAVGQRPDQEVDRQDHPAAPKLPDDHQEEGCPDDEQPQAAGIAEGHVSVSPIRRAPGCAEPASARSPRWP